uniref:Uncharacterized protein n=1 Tax=Anopheles epiroticus TaxID=199890 RepID=A0A182PVM1_9DIPT
MVSQLVWLCVGALFLYSAVHLADGNPIETVTANNPLLEPTAIGGAGPTLDTLLPTKPSEVASSTESSKMSRFLDDFTSAFKHGTAKMKESLESAASSVKDGVLQGYDYVRSKLTGGTGPESATVLPTLVGDDVTNNSSATPSTAAALTSTHTPSTERAAISGDAGASAGPADTKPNVLAALGGAVGVSNEPARIVPNDDEDDERIFFNDKDYTAVKPLDGSEDERDVTESPVTTTVAVDNRFIIAGPLACKSGQEVVNGKCRNVF